jgi:hypothetical protein
MLLKEIELENKKVQIYRKRPTQKLEYDYYLVLFVKNTTTGFFFVNEHYKQTESINSSKRAIETAHFVIKTF